MSASLNTYFQRNWDLKQFKNDDQETLDTIVRQLCLIREEISGSAPRLPSGSILSSDQKTVAMFWNTHREIASYGPGEALVKSPRDASDRVMEIASLKRMESILPRNKGILSAMERRYDRLRNMEPRIRRLLSISEELQRLSTNFLGAKESSEASLSGITEVTSPSCASWDNPDGSTPRLVRPVLDDCSCPSRAEESTQHNSMEEEETKETDLQLGHTLSEEDSLDSAAFGARSEKSLRENTFQENGESKAYVEEEIRLKPSNSFEQQSPQSGFHDLMSSSAGVEANVVKERMHSSSSHRNQLSVYPVFNHESNPTRARGESCVEEEQPGPSSNFVQRNSPKIFSDDSKYANGDKVHDLSSQQDPSSRHDRQFFDRMFNDESKHAVVGKEYVPRSQPDPSSHHDPQSDDRTLIDDSKHADVGKEYVPRSQPDPSSRNERHCGNQMLIDDSKHGAVSKEYVLRSQPDPSSRNERHGGNQMLIDDSKHADVGKEYVLRSQPDPSSRPEGQVVEIFDEHSMTPSVADGQSDPSSHDERQSVSPTHHAEGCETHRSSLHDRQPCEIMNQSVSPTDNATDSGPSTGKIELKGASTRVVNMEPVDGALEVIDYQLSKRTKEQTVKEQHQWDLKVAAKKSASRQQEGFSTKILLLPRHSNAKPVPLRGIPRRPSLSDKLSKPSDELSYVTIQDRWTELLQKQSNPLIREQPPPRVASRDKVIGSGARMNTEKQSGVSSDTVNANGENAACSVVSCRFVSTTPMEEDEVSSAYRPSTKCSNDSEEFELGNDVSRSDGREDIEQEVLLQNYGCDRQRKNKKESSKTSHRDSVKTPERSSKVKKSTSVDHNRRTSVRSASRSGDRGRTSHADKHNNSKRSGLGRQKPPAASSSLSKDIRKKEIDRMLAAQVGERRNSTTAISERSLELAYSKSEDGIYADALAFNDQNTDKKHDPSNYRSRRHGIDTVNKMRLKEEGVPSRRMEQTDLDHVERRRVLVNAKKEVRSLERRANDRSQRNNRRLSVERRSKVGGTPSNERRRTASRTRSSSQHSRHRSRREEPSSGA